MLQPLTCNHLQTPSCLRRRPAQGACLEEDKMLLITEFMDGGDLHKAINKHQISWYKRCGALNLLCCVAADITSDRIILRPPQHQHHGGDLSSLKGSVGQ